MSHQSRKVTDRLKASRTLVLPNTRDPRQHWLIIRREPMDNKPGCFFVTHARNASKFDAMPSHFIVAQTYDRADATAAAHRATMICGPSYQPKNSAHNGPLWTPPPKPSFQQLFGGNPKVAPVSESGDRDDASLEGSDTIRNPSDIQ